MISIVFDKLMQYQIVDPSDIIGWCFSFDEANELAKSKIDTQDWDLLKAALDKSIGRVAIAQQKVQSLRKEEEDAKAKAAAAASAAQGADDDMGIESEETKRGKLLQFVFLDS